MDFPGRIIKKGEKDAKIVRAIARQLTLHGIKVGAPDGVFDAGLAASVKLFQTLNHSVTGEALTIDGEVGPMTWGALFPDQQVVAKPAPGGALALAALAVAQGQIGTMEVPKGSNSGPKVNEYLKSTGSSPGNYWCMAFVYWCFQEAAANEGLKNTFPKTAHCLTAWNAAKAMRITRAVALQKPSLVGPGAVFILDLGGGSGHTGFVLANNAGSLVTIEGNSNSDGSNNGIGVFKLNRRNIANKPLKGFIIVP